MTANRNPRFIDFERIIDDYQRSRIITLCRVCNLAIYDLPGLGWRWSHFHAMDHRAEPKEWFIVESKDRAHW